LRWRKDAFLLSRYSVSMDASITAKSTVNELLAAHPQAAAIFLALRTSCVGCYLARFCTLEDVARDYKLPVPDLLNKLQASIQFSEEE
jgi:hybrid cluster-associated redox disulfide protein